MSLETRVGMCTITILKDMCKDYIQAYTLDKMFVGDTHVIKVYKSYMAYLEVIEWN